MLYQHLVASGQYQPGAKLPPVLPVVIYNGEQRWNSPAEMRELIAEVPDGLEKYLPRLHSLILDEGCFPEAHLHAMRNLVAALFRLENSRAGKDKEAVIENLRKVLAVLIDWLKEPEQAGLRRDFTVWLRRVLIPARVPDASLAEVIELQEMNDMLYETVQNWYREAEAKGKAEGKAGLLFELLELKFGKLDEHVHRRIDSLDDAALEKCARRLFSASSLQDVFGDESLH